MKFYEVPEVQVSMFAIADILTTSGEDLGGAGGENELPF